MDEFLRANQTLWNEWTAEHEKSPFYKVEEFKAGKERLKSIELEEVGDVNGKTLLHLQCHFGLDTLAWARHGATVTGVDLSNESIALAKSLSAELNIPANFVCSDVLTLPDALQGQFDIVFSSYGILHWLRDLNRWAQVIAHFLKPGGFFYIVEDHPFMRVFSFDSNAQNLKVDNPYFFSEEPYRAESTGSYATNFVGQNRTYYMWDHSLGEVVNSLIGAGLRIEFLHEFPVALRAKFPNMVEGEDHYWRFIHEHNMVPLLFSLKASKPAQ
ncbi:MAG: class I SAM-dependent methyltransferase [Anaerolineales bacterium]